MSNKDIFDNIYENNLWGGDSGTGSIPDYASKYIDLVSSFIIGYNIKTVLDLGSGDTRILRAVISPTQLESYTCIEVSSLAISRYYQDTKDITRKVKNFNVINDDIITCEYPKVDLILIKDVLQHLNNESVSIVMEKILKSCKYAIITNDILPSNKNVDIKNGEHRGLNLKIDPFNYTDLQVIKSYKSNVEQKIVMLYRNLNEII